MKLTLALSKGRIFEESVAILSRVGIRPLEDPEKSRKLIIETSHADVRLIIVRVYIMGAELVLSGTLY